MVKGCILDSSPRDSSLPVDLIRAVAIFLVILVHAAEEPFPITAAINQVVYVRWISVDIYNSIAQMCVPLFVMLSGALLLQPYKVDEPLRVFFKKRFVRVGLPLVFWGGAYFAWGYFADNKALTVASIGQGILTGPYYHFWYLYMLIGLYIVTPLLRVLVANARRNMLRYFLLLWFIGTAISSYLNLSGTYTLNSDLFLLTGYVGYFLLGFYFLNTPQLNAKILSTIAFIGLAWTAIGTYFASYYIGGSKAYFFMDFVSVNIILASAAVFLLMWKVPAEYVETKSKPANRVIHFISQCSLAIYLMHIIILESLQRGYFGFQISINTLNPIIEIPFAAIVTFLICLAILYPVSKIPTVKKIIGVL